MLGFIGTLTLVVGGALSGASTHLGGGRWWSVPTVPVRPSVDVVVALVIFYAGLIVLARAWLRLRRDAASAGVTVGAIALVVVIWALPLLAGPPLGSRDVYAYAAQGKLADEGFDPYIQGPSALGDDPVLEPVDPIYLDAPVLYGPVFVAVSSGVSRAATDLVVVVMVFRAIAVLGLLVTALAVYDLAKGWGRDPVDAIVLTMANPLVLLHLVSGAHNESLMLAFLVGGVAVGRRPQLRLVGIGLCAFAASIKMPAFFGVAFLTWPWIAESGLALATRIRRAGAATVEAFAVIALAGHFTGWGWGWVDAITGAKPVDAYLSLTRLAGGAVQLSAGLEGDDVLELFRVGGLAVVVVTSAFLLFRRSHHPRALALALLVFAVLHPTTQPWYLTWGLMLWAAASAGEENRTFVWGCIAAAFVVLPMGPHLGHLVLDNSSRRSIALAAAALLTLIAAGPIGARLPRPSALLAESTR
ncbi:MAG: polyprenol phosphomannose-dependent alpha 1,6 mannosyltransferase MptB [Acidimicrobiales bacterium]